MVVAQVGDPVAAGDAGIRQHACEPVGAPGQLVVCRVDAAEADRRHPAGRDASPLQPGSQTVVGHGLTYSRGCRRALVDRKTMR